MVPTFKNRRREDVDHDCCCVGWPWFDLGHELQIPFYGHSFEHWGVLGKIAYPLLYLPRFSKMSNPEAVTVPSVADKSPVIIRMVVVLPVLRLW